MDNLAGGYEKILGLFDCLLDGAHTLLPWLGLLLAAGNYLNGGNTARGQADGFEFEDLLKMEQCKDNLEPEKSLISWAQTQFFGAEYFELTREALVSALGRTFANVRRVVMKGDGGAKVLKKSLKFAKEDFDAALKEATNELKKNTDALETMNDVTPDPLDSVKKFLVPEYEAIDARMQKIVENQELCVSISPSRFNSVAV